METVRPFTKFSLLALASSFLLAVTPGPAEAADAGGFTDLLSGGLKGWVAEGKTSIERDGDKHPVWTIDDGVVRCAGGGYGFLRYDKKLCDFTLRLEYRMSKGCNSGIGIRSVPYTGGSKTRPSFAGYELQILDDAGRDPTKHSTMSLYRYVAPKSNPVKPHGEWNELEVTCRGPNIRVVLNGQVVHDLDQTEVKAIKDKPLCGYVSLQNHGKVIEFRNLGAKEL